MENTSPAHIQTQNASSPDIATGGHKRSGSGASILSKFPFLRTSENKPGLNEFRHAENSQDLSTRPPRALVATFQQQKTRRRKGSLRKVALLGRGAAREKRELKPLAIDISQTAQSTPDPGTTPKPKTMAPDENLGLGISDLTPRPSMDGYASKESLPVSSPQSPDNESHLTSPAISYTSTTDEDDILSIPIRVPSPLRPELSPVSSGSDSYFQNRAAGPSLQRRRSIKHAKSPLSLQGLAASPLPAAHHHENHDYSETEWWGWVVLVVTWFVFVIGMGSCLNVWSWAWDVGTTPYAPPELEDDPTLPIVGYYPALLILTCIMAWVWVIVAWTGMKYFRHAKISGD
ncbi:uncharacterized protein F4812DRAFT_369197 [Daldinia caldariorum]|uniref:uncharacterized protein n=1 Tax=Daldinia caldariorum TaxID=326644 RepID=UPI002008EA23|nr:uncharacterized protein F4812DRAFT_369197 [Daldinia caldariorum]KAI1468444.1 hypothetical protein F4812DRAFT_369197 [Daldinia caldariorum]